MKRRVLWQKTKILMQHENEDLGNWVISLMEEFIENDDLNDYIFSSLPEDSKLSDE